MQAPGECQKKTGHIGNHGIHYEFWRNGREAVKAGLGLMRTQTYMWITLWHRNRGVTVPPRGRVPQVYLESCSWSTLLADSQRSHGVVQKVRSGHEKYTWSAGIGGGKAHVCNKKHQVFGSPCMLKGWLFSWFRKRKQGVLVYTCNHLEGRGRIKHSRSGRTKSYFCLNNTSLSVCVSVHDEYIHVSEYKRRCQRTICRVSFFLYHVSPREQSYSGHQAWQQEPLSTDWQILMD